MILDRTVTDEIEADMHSWLDQFIEAQQPGPPRGRGGNAPKADVKPFHAALLPKSFIRLSVAERSFSTSLGNSYERHSAIIARPRFAAAELQHKTEGEMLESTDTEISDEVGKINKGHVFPDYLDVVGRIVAMEAGGAGKKVTRAVTSDLYLRRDDGGEVFFEIKSPKPNKEQCLNITRKHLWIHAIKKKTHPGARTYFGMPYNPYGEGNEYRHSFAINHLDLEHQTLIGKQYWDFLGGGGAYEELLEIYRRVGIAKSGSIRRLLEM